MVTPIGSLGGSRPVDQLRTEAPKGGAAVQAVATEAAAPTAPTNPVQAMADQGAPIDSAKVASIKAAIAGGTYKVDPQAIADKMIAQDLPA